MAVINKFKGMNQKYDVLRSCSRPTRMVPTAPTIGPLGIRLPNKNR